MFGLKILTLLILFVAIYIVRCNSPNLEVKDQRGSAPNFALGYMNNHFIDLNNYPSNTCIIHEHLEKYPPTGFVFSIDIDPKRLTGCFILYNEPNCQGVRLKFNNVGERRRLKFDRRAFGTRKKEMLANFNVVISSLSSCPPDSHFSKAGNSGNDYALRIENYSKAITETCSDINIHQFTNASFIQVFLDRLSKQSTEADNDPQICVEIYSKKACKGEMIQFIISSPFTETDRNLLRNSILLWHADDIYSVLFNSVKKCPYLSLNRFMDNIIPLKNSSANPKILAVEDNSHTLWKYVAILIGTVVLVVSIWRAYKLLTSRSSSTVQVLTRREIDEFRHGVENNDYQEKNDENFLSAIAVKKPYNRMLEIPKDEFKILTDQLLGDGEFGLVFKALVKGNTQNTKEVALKMTKSHGGATALKGLLSEIKILTYLGHHPNIVPILGAYTAEIEHGIAYVATEICSLGSLRHFLKTYQDDTKPLDASSVPFDDMLRWSHEIACGMEYIGQKGVIHADLATRNVLVSSERIARISDFGLSRRLYEYAKYTKTSQEPLPWRWMAYESLKRMEFSTKSDVWSYGVSLWEIFTLGSQPYPGFGWSIDFLESLEEGFRLKKPRYATSDVFEVMKKCWNLDKDTRPSFTDLKQWTDQLLASALKDLYTTLMDCPRIEMET